MGIYDINWKCTYKKMPKEVRNFLKGLLGMDEYKKLMQSIKSHKWIMMVGPECSGKSTVRKILWALGYPFIIEDNGIGRVIHTSRKPSVLKDTDDILKELGIYGRHCNVNKARF